MRFPMFQINSKKLKEPLNVIDLYLNKTPTSFVFDTLTEAETFIKECIYIDCDGNGFGVDKISLDKKVGRLAFIYGARYCLKFKIKSIDYKVTLDEFKEIYLEKFTEVFQGIDYETEFNRVQKAKSINQIINDNDEV